MIHKNCKIEIQCKNVENNCIKRFSNRLQIVSNLNNFSNYLYYRRINDNNVSKTCWNDSMIVLYNVYFLLRFNVHINVEICTSIKFIVYLYKYVFKNSNFVNVEIITTKEVNRFVHVNNSILIVDECITYHENKWINFCKTTWKILNLFFDQIKFFVVRLQIYLSNMQRVLIRFENRIIVVQLMQNEIFRQIILIEYFFMNKRVRNVEKNDAFFLRI